MEDGAKEDPAQCKVPKFLGKAGWVKKAPGRLLASYKDRYIHVERTEIVVYENEDLQKCLERFNLENYDKCHELKSPFTKKHRLILIRSPKSGNKVHDVKFQAQTAEEKEAWIKAVSDGINRAKNKIFDEVKVDESSNLEHVTRTRPKGNRNRRPPTRIHMKEVAGVSSDGILRLDLDLEDAVMPNGTHNATVDGNEAPKEAKKVLMPPSNAKEVAVKQVEPIAEEETQTESEVSPQKKVIKPPMPPTKEVKPISSPEEEPEKDNSSEKKVLKPPMPPSKEAKPCASPVEEATEGATTEKMSEKSPEVKKKEPPPTPPNKPTSISINDPAEASQSRPCPPSQDKKPSSPVVERNQEVQGTTDENKKEEDSRKETTVTPVEIDEPLPSDRDDKTPSTEQQVCEEESGETISGIISGINKASNNEPQMPVSLISASTELPKKSPPTPKKKPSELHKPNTHIEDNTTGTHVGEDPTSCLQTASDTSLQAEEELPKSEVPTVMVCLNDPVADSPSLSPLLCHLPGEKKKKAEEKSVDSGQHSDDDSEGSGSEDTLAASTAALRGSHAGLDVLDASEDNIQTPVSLQPAQAATKPKVKAKGFAFRHSVPISPLKPSTKAKSASSGNLLSDSSAVCTQVRQDTRTVAGSDGAPGDDVMKLETEVALEMKTTSELLSKVSQSQEGGFTEDKPEDLLTKAIEKLKMADNVLREVKKLKLAKNSNKRNSW